MPQGLYAHAAAAMVGKIYVTGGKSQGSSRVSPVYMYMCMCMHMHMHMHM